MIDAAEQAAFIVTPVVLLLFLAVPFAGHLRVFARLTGSEPLQPGSRRDAVSRDEYGASRRSVQLPTGSDTDSTETMAATMHATAAGRRLELPPAPAVKAAAADGGGEQ